MTFVINVFHLITLLIVKCRHCVRGDRSSNIHVFVCVCVCVWLVPDKRYRWWLNRRVGCMANKYNCSPLTTMFRFNWKLYVRLTLLLIRFVLPLPPSHTHTHTYTLSYLLSLFHWLICSLIVHPHCSVVRANERTRTNGLNTNMCVGDPDIFVIVVVTANLLPFAS